MFLGQNFNEKKAVKYQILLLVKLTFHALQALSMKVLHMNASESSLHCPHFSWRWLIIKN